MKILKYDEMEDYKRWLAFFRKNIGYRWKVNGRTLDKWEAFSLIENGKMTEEKLNGYKVATMYCFKK